MKNLNKQYWKPIMKKKIHASSSYNMEDDENLYRSLFENVHDGIYRSTAEGTILTANPALVKMLGYDSEEELKKLNIGSDIYVKPDERKSNIEAINASGRLKDVELVLKRKDGKLITVLENSHSVSDRKGDILYFEGTLVDITERKKAEEALRESENRYHTLIETLQDGISLFDLSGKLYYFNQRKKTMLSYRSDKELMALNTFDMIHHGDREKARKIFSELISKGSIGQKEIRILRKDGSFFWAEFSATVLKDTRGNPTFIMDTMRDISERKRLEEEMKLRLEQLRQIIDLVPSYIFAKDINGRFLLANKALADVFHMNPDEIQGKRDSDYGATRDQVKWYRKMDLEVIKNGISVHIPEEQVLRKDGTLGWFQTVKIPYRHPGYDKPAILGVATEITGRKKVEDELRRSEKRFRKLFESHSAVKLIINPEDGSIIDANRAASDFYGWPVAVLRKMTIFDINISGEATVRGRMDKAVRSRSVHFETAHRLADRSERDVEVFSSKIELDDKIYLHSIVHDITEKKKILADLITAKEKAEESDRLKTAFLHNISHEIRTPMNAIVGFTSLLEAPDLAEDARRQYIGIVLQSCNQLLSIITDIVDISNIETGRVKVNSENTDLNRIFLKLNEQFSMRASSEGLSLICKREDFSKDAKIATDETKLIQILSNLLNNAFKFTRQGKIVFGYKIRNNEVEVFVKDTGIGIYPEYHERIFDRFFQVSGAQDHKTEGTGLGLAISKAYVEMLGGKIKVQSTPGKGSLFSFTLPVEPLNTLL